MNREKAERLDRETREYLRELSQELNVDDAFGVEIMEQYLEIIPEVHRKDMIFLGTTFCSGRHTLSIFIRVFQKRARML